MKEFYEREFEARKNSPLWWHNKASDLFASAGALHFVMSKTSNDIPSELGFEKGFSMGVACNPVYQMLFGMSFEAILKAICVVKDIQVPTTHNLVSLANTAGLAITDKEKSIFEFLTESTVWNGRYPVPKKQEFLEKHWKQGSDLLFYPVPSKGVLKFRTPNDILSWESLSSIWRRLSNEFFKLYT